MVIELLLLLLLLLILVGGAEGFGYGDEGGVWMMLVLDRAAVIQLCLERLLLVLLVATQLELLYSVTGRFHGRD